METDERKMQNMVALTKKFRYNRSMVAQIVKGKAGKTMEREVKEYYGVYRYGFFGEEEQICLLINFTGVEGRGYQLQEGTKKYAITEFRYHFSEFNEFSDIEEKKFDNKMCNMIWPDNRGDKEGIYLPGLEENGQVIRMVFQEYFEAYRAEELRKAEELAKSALPSNSEEGMQIFKDKITKLKVMLDNGMMTEDEYNTTREQLMEQFSNGFVLG